MNKNTQTETAKKGQAVNNNKKSKTPTGKIVLMKETEARKKAREESYRTFRINALRRRCKRMKLDDEKTEELVKKLIEQMDAPKEYSILVMLDGCKGKKIPNPDGEGELFKSAGEQFNESLTKANIKYKYRGDTYFSLDGNQDVLAKIREIAPDGAKIYPYAKKMESVLPKGKECKSEYVAKNTDKSSTAKYRRLARKADKLRKKQLDGMAHNDQELHAKLQKQRRMSSRRKVKTALKKLHIKLSGYKKKRSSIVVKLPAKNTSTGSKKASTNVKKAA
jgi:hypothetical protein